jgi:hypothetical protein
MEMRSTLLMFCEPQKYMNWGIPQFQPGTLYPVYVRGQTYLRAGNGSEAAAEFQKIIAHRGIVLNFPLGTLAHLGIARADALSGGHRQSACGVSGFPRTLERRRPRHPYLERSQGRVCKIAVIATNFVEQNFCQVA